MALKKFEAIREQLSHEYQHVSSGKMMSSPAIHYERKVFAFFSLNEAMVFKLGKGYPVENLKVTTGIFSPFKSGKPLSGWYEISKADSKHWLAMSELALSIAKAANPQC